MAINPLRIPEYQQPRDIDFTSLANLPQVYQKAQQRQGLADLGRGLADGTLDYRQAAAKAAEFGDTDSTMKFLALDEQKKKQAQETAASDRFTGSLSGAYGGGQAGAPNYGNAIAGIESGGKYDALGPVTKTGDRAYGKYQVMGANIPAWTKAHLGQEMTPEQFIANPQAQDAVFKAQFGQYAQKHGPEGAARAWFAGEGGMNNPNARDQLGTTVSGYANKFNAGMGQQPYQVAQAGGGMPAQGPSQASGSVPIPVLLQAINDRNLPAAQKDIAKELFKRALDEAKPPERIKMLQMLQANPELKALELEMRAAGGTKVNVDTKGETEFDKELGKGQAKRWNGYIEAGEAAQKKNVDINNMRVISQRMGSQGKLADAKEVFGPYAEALGINIDGLSDVQAYSSIIQRLAPQQRAEGSGSTSDIEFKGFIKGLPALSQNPVARGMTLDTMDALNRDEMARGEIATKLATKEIGRVEAEKQLRALPDPMKSFSEWRKANPEIYGQALKGANAPAARPKMSNSDVDQSLANARAKITSDPGSREAVIKKLRENNIDPSGL